MKGFSRCPVIAEFARQRNHVDFQAMNQAALGHLPALAQANGVPKANAAAASGQHVTPHGLTAMPVCP